MICKPLDRNERVKCSFCGWFGKVNDCRIVPDDLVYCPVCIDVPVEKDNDNQQTIDQ